MLERHHQDSNALNESFWDAQGFEIEQHTIFENPFGFRIPPQEKGNGPRAPVFSRGGARGPGARFFVGVVPRVPGSSFFSVWYRGSRALGFVRGGAKRIGPVVLFGVVPKFTTP